MEKRRRLQELCNKRLPSKARPDLQLSKKWLTKFKLCRGLRSFAAYEKSNNTKSDAAQSLMFYLSKAAKANKEINAFNVNEFKLVYNPALVRTTAIQCPQTREKQKVP